MIGFDNLREADHMNPPLTPIDQSLDKMVNIAMEMIVTLVKGESLTMNPAGEGNLYKIPTQLEIRDSCAPVPCHSPDEPSGTYLVAQ